MDAGPARAGVAEPSDEAELAVDDHLRSGVQPGLTGV